MKNLGDIIVEITNSVVEKAKNIVKKMSDITNISDRFFLLAEIIENIYKMKYFQGETENSEKLRSNLIQVITTTIVNDTVSTINQPFSSQEQREDAKMIRQARDKEINKIIEGTEEWKAEKLKVNDAAEPIFLEEENTNKDSLTYLNEEHMIPDCFGLGILENVNKILHTKTKKPLPIIKKIVPKYQVKTANKQQSKKVKLPSTSLNSRDKKGKRVKMPK